MRLTIMAGARPNFMKIAPFIHAIKMAHNSGKIYNISCTHWSL